MKTLYRLCLGAALAFACTAFAASQSSEKNPVSLHTSLLGSYHVRTVLIDSRPTGSEILINGNTVGKTPVIVDIAVDDNGYALRPLVLRAIAPLPTRNASIARYYPLSLSARANRVPAEIDFDLFIGTVQVVKIAQD